MITDFFITLSNRLLVLVLAIFPDTVDLPAGFTTAFETITTAISMILYFVPVLSIIFTTLYYVLLVKLAIIIIKLVVWIIGWFAPPGVKPQEFPIYSK